MFISIIVLRVIVWYDSYDSYRSSSWVYRPHMYYIQLKPIEEVQMRAVRIFMGVGRLHPPASLQFEMNMLPVKWEAMKRSIEFGYT